MKFFFFLNLSTPCGKLKKYAKKHTEKKLIASGGNAQEAADVGGSFYYRPEISSSPGRYCRRSFVLFVQ